MEMCPQSEDTFLKLGDHPYVVYHMEHRLTLDQNVQNYFNPNMKYIKIQLEPFFYYLLVMIYTKMNDTESAMHALRSFEKCLDKELPFPSRLDLLHPLVLLGYCYEAFDDKEQAKTAFQIANNYLLDWEFRKDENQVYKLVKVFYIVE